MVASDEEGVRGTVRDDRLRGLDLAAAEESAEITRNCCFEEGMAIESGVLVVTFFYSFE